MIPATSRLPKIERVNLEQSADWDGLWSASSASLPTLRRDCLVHYVRTFSKPQSFAAATVRRSDRLVAALPLISRSRAGLPSTLSLPTNPWMKCGDLLVDQAFSNDSTVFDELAVQILHWPGWMLDFQWITPTADWDQLLEAFRRRGCQIDRRRQFDVGLIDVRGNWDDYYAGLSKGHRKKLRSRWRQLQQLGPVTLQRHRRIGNSKQLSALMTEVIRIEKSGWKGQQGSAIGSRPEIERFYRQVARTLDQAGLVEIHMLCVAGRPVAFDLGYLADHTWYSHKVGYDSEFANYSPGQLLLYQQLQRWFTDDQVRQVDTMGIFSDATAKWTRQTRPAHRYRISRPGSIDRWAWSGLRLGRDLVGKLGRGR